MKTYNIMVTGVGGQGNLLCGAVLADAAMEAGLKPVMGETFGASRRGGGVITHLRISDEDRGPLIPLREVDLMVGMEPLETLRAARDFGGQRTSIVMSDMRVETMDTLSGARRYPDVDEIADCLTELCREVHVLSPSDSLEELGTTRVLNAYMIGASSYLIEMPMMYENIVSALKKMHGNKDLNMRAFEQGIADAEFLTSGYDD